MVYPAESVWNKNGSVLSLLWSCPVTLFGKLHRVFYCIKCVSAFLYETNKEEEKEGEKKKKPYIRGGMKMNEYECGN